MLGMQTTVTIAEKMASADPTQKMPVSPRYFERAAKLSMI